MDQTLTVDQTRFITLSGHAEAIPLTNDAYADLQRYLAHARRSLSSDPDADETIRDLEVTLGERMQGVVDETNAPVSSIDMSRLLDEAGEVPGTAETPELTAPPARGAFWCRINEGKWFGGLCLGVASRGEFRIDWVRTIAIFLVLVTGGLIGFVYLALLLVVPRVETVDEYRALRDKPAFRTNPTQR